MNGKWILVYAAVLHLAWAAILLAFPPVRTTAIDWILKMFGGYSTVAGLALAASAGLALSGLRLRDHPAGSFFMVLPQQFLVIVSAVGAISAMLAGHFADGVVRPSEFIIADQAPAVLLAVLHAAALVERYAWRPYLNKARAR